MRHGSAAICACLLSKSPVISSHKRQAFALPPPLSLQAGPVCRLQLLLPSFPESSLPPASSSSLPSRPSLVTPAPP